MKDLKTELTLTIHLVNLIEIVKGIKREEYRSPNEYYEKRFFLPANTETHIKTIILRCANQKINYWAKIEVEKIKGEIFKNFIPEGFKFDDAAYTIYIKKVIEHNLHNLLK